MQNKPKTALIALGANLTSPGESIEESIARAILELPTDEESIFSRSDMFRTPCFPPGAGPDFVNAAVSLHTRRSPQQLLKHLHAIEEGFGRVRAKRWGERTLDLDLIAIEDVVLPDEKTFQSWLNLPQEKQSQMAPGELILPHPRMQDRGFVLAPLVQVAPNWCHPVIGKTVNQLYNDLPDAEKENIKPL